MEAMLVKKFLFQESSYDHNIGSTSHVNGKYFSFLSGWLIKCPLTKAKAKPWQK
jgi:hypothetical protein